MSRFGFSLTLRALEKPDGMPSRQFHTKERKQAAVVSRQMQAKSVSETDRPLEFQPWAGTRLSKRH